MRRKSFEPLFVQIPRHWISALGRSSSANTYRLALLILWEAFKDRRRNGRVTLSAKVTGMSATSRRRAAIELVELGLITIENQGRNAWQAKLISHSTNKKNNKNRTIRTSTLLPVGGQQGGKHPVARWRSTSQWGFDA
jgi:hypothetical protein